MILSYPNLSHWSIVNDTVMGGISNANLSLSDSGAIVFQGHVSLENNGGFAMVQCKFDRLKVDAFSKVVLKVKGDGKTYQFRIKSNQNDKHAYVSSFKTTAQTTTIDISFSTMYPAYRGKKLDLDNSPREHMEMIAFLIGNKKEEDFKLEIESIELK